MLNLFWITEADPDSLTVSLESSDEILNRQCIQVETLFDRCNDLHVARRRRTQEPSDVLDLIQFLAISPDCVDKGNETGGKLINRLALLHLQIFIAFCQSLKMRFLHAGMTLVQDLDRLPCILRRFLSDEVLHHVLRHDGVERR